jgi:drug/metabolite transporter (DMT)-like permease
MVGSGLCDTGANITFLLALEYGSLAPVAVLSSLYPAATVIWARVVLGERIDRQRTIGLCAAVASVALIAGG